MTALATQPESVEAGGAIRAILPYFGGKRSLADTIAVELGTPQMRVVPFCGSLAVEFACSPCGHELSNDLNGHVVNLAHVLASGRCVELYERCRRVLNSSTLHDEARRRIGAIECRKRMPTPADVDAPTDFHIEWAFWFLVRDWQGRNGTSGTSRGNITFGQRYTPNGGGGARRWAQAVESMPWWHERLRSIQVLHVDALGLIESTDDLPSVSIYADPPYLTRTRGKGGGSRYQHDLPRDPWAEMAWHAHLARLLRAKKQARIVVSYYAAPEIEALYPGWTIVRLDTLKALSAQNKRGNIRVPAPEILIINGPSYSDPDQLHLFDSPTPPTP